MGIRPDWLRLLRFPGNSVGIWGFQLELVAPLQAVWISSVESDPHVIALYEIMLQISCSLGELFPHSPSCDATAHARTEFVNTQTLCRLDAVKHPGAALLASDFSAPFHTLTHTHTH